MEKIPYDRLLQDEKEIRRYRDITGENVVQARIYLEMFNKHVGMYLEPDLLDYFRASYLEHIFVLFFFMGCTNTGVAFLTELIEFTKKALNRELTQEDLAKLVLFVMQLGHGLLPHKQKENEEPLFVRPQIGK